MATGETKRKWEEENLVRINLSLNRTNDADILDALEKSGEPKGTAVKRLIRLGLDKQANK